MTKAPLDPASPDGDDLTPGGVATGLTLGLLTLVTLAGNVLVFLAVLSDKKLRTVSNLFIVSLSLADLLVGTVVMVPATLSEVCQRWVLGEAFCPVWASFDVMLTSASVLNVCLISFDRYLSIMTPLRYNALMTGRRAGLLLVAAWSIAVLSSFVPITNGWHNPHHNTLTNLTVSGPVPQCVLRVSLPYALTASFVTIFLPIIIAFVLYCRVSAEAKRQALFVRSLIAPSRVLLGQDFTNNSIREPFTRKATVTLGVIVGAYVVTWTPFLVTNVIDAQCKCVPAKLFGAFVWLGYCNSLVNPIIYPLLMRDFRKVYMTHFRSCCPSLALAIFLRKSPKQGVVKETPVDSTLDQSHQSILDRSLKNSLYETAHGLRRVSVNNAHLNSSSYHSNSVGHSHVNAVGNFSAPFLSVSNALGSCIVAGGGTTSTCAHCAKALLVCANNGLQYDLAARKPSFSHSHTCDCLPPPSPYDQGSKGHAGMKVSSKGAEEAPVQNAEDVLTRRAHERLSTSDSELDLCQMIQVPVDAEAEAARSREDLLAAGCLWARDSFENMFQTMWSEERFGRSVSVGHEAARILLEGARLFDDADTLQGDLGGPKVANVSSPGHSGDLNCLRSTEGRLSSHPARGLEGGSENAECEAAQGAERNEPSRIDRQQHHLDDAFEQVLKDESSTAARTVRAHDEGKLFDFDGGSLGVEGHWVGNEEARATAVRDGRESNSEEGVPGVGPAPPKDIEDQEADTQRAKQGLVTGAVGVWEVTHRPPRFEDVEGDKNSRLGGVEPNVLADFDTTFPSRFFTPTRVSPLQHGVSAFRSSVLLSDELEI